MKLSKYAKLVKNEGYCNVVHVVGSGIWLGTQEAIFRATELPDMEGEDQVRTVLDMTEKAWKKVYMTESHAESVRNILGMNLAEFEKGEQKTEKLKMVAAYCGHLVSVLRCENDGEIIFYDESLTGPIAEEIKNSEYIIYTVRKTASGQRYLVVRNGLNVLAAIMPVQVVTQEFLADLSEFQAICTEQYYREKDRADAVAAQMDTQGAEQIEMEESKNDQ